MNTTLGCPFNRKRVKPNASVYFQAKLLGFTASFSEDRLSGLRHLFSEVGILLDAVQPNLQEIIKRYKVYLHIALTSL